jgi:GntR family transcriptional repressor for pyruvate dehydrogenase complex
MQIFQALPPVSVKSRSHQVEQALLDLLDNGSLVTGQRLPPELELASQFGVSRATVREAIVRLRADGVVSTKPGRGAVVESRASLALRLESLPNSKGADTWAQLFELRQMIEIEAAGLSAKRHTASDLIAIEVAFADIEKAVATQSHASQADLAFHHAITAATQNPHLLALLDFISAKLDHLLVQAWQNAARHIGHAHHAQAEHRTLLDAIRMRDDKGARCAAKKHLQASQARLASYFEQENAEGTMITPSSS